MSYLPKYYFQDIPAAVMEEIIQAMERALPEPSWEEIDHWLNCHNEGEHSRLVREGGGVYLDSPLLIKRERE